MKKLLVALTAALGLASASVPASAGGSFSVSAYVSAPVYSHGYYAPRYSYVAPVRSFVFTTAPSYSYGYSPYRAHRKARKAARRAYRRALRRNHVHGYNHW